MIARPAARRLAARSRAGFTLLEVLAVVAILVILASVSTFAVVSYIRGAKMDEATLKAQNLQKAAEAYYLKSGGNWPPNLEVLVTQTDAGPPLVVGGPAAMFDPWGNQFQYDIRDVDGAQRAYVFTQSPDGVVIQWPKQ